jgi:hypothetical protein
MDSGSKASGHIDVDVKRAYTECGKAASSGLKARPVGGRGDNAVPKDRRSDPRVTGLPDPGADWLGRPISRSHVIPNANAVDVVEQLAVALGVRVILRRQHGLHDTRAIGVDYVCDA